MKARRQQRERWVGVGELVVDLLGHSDKPTCDLITRYAKGTAKNGFDAIPPKFIRDEMNPENRKQRFRYLSSSRSLVFFKNVLDLHSFLPPKTVASILRRERRGLELREALAQARAELRAQWDVFGKWLTAWEEIEARLLDERWDPREEPLLVEQDRQVGTAPSPGGAVRVSGHLPASLSLHMARQLDELEKRLDPRTDALGVQANKALHVLGLGEAELAAGMVRQALDQDPSHPLANYAFAAVYLARAADAGREAARYRLLSEEAGLSHEAYFENLAADAFVDGRTGRRAALKHLVVAHRRWPFEEWNGHRVWLDHSRRERVMTLVAELAFEFCHDHGSVDMGDYLNIGRRRAGEAIAAYFDQETDEGILGILRELEEHPPISVDRRAFGRETQLLQIYYALSPEDYARFFPIWLQRFEKHSAAEVEPYVGYGGGYNAWGKVVREHLRRNLSDEDRVALLRDLEERSVTDTREYHAGVRAFMDRANEEPDPDEEPSIEEF